MNPVNNDSKNNAIASSTPSVDMSGQFKTFSHLLTPHDIYKLVNVTPSASVLASMHPSMTSQLQQQSMEQNTFDSPSARGKINLTKICFIKKNNL